MNSLEQPTESLLVERIKPEVAAFAAEGCRSWRESQIDVSLLMGVPAVQAQLAVLEQSAELDGTDRARQDLERDAIQAAIETAIKSLPHPYSSAALDRFGFTDDGKLPSGKGVLEKRAIQHFPRIGTTRWWTKPQRKYSDLSPHNYVVALVTCALCGIADPAAFLAERHPSPADGVAAEPEPADQPQAGDLRTGSRARAIAAGVAASLGLAVAAWAIWGSGGGRSDARAIPPQGSVVDAQTGKVSPASSLPAHPAATGGQLGGGHIIHACVVGPTGCAYPLKGQPVIAAPRDVVHVDLVLHNPEAAPLSEAKLSVAVTRQVASGVVTASYEWPNGNRNSAGIETIFSYPLTVAFADHKAHVLRYVDGSSLLYSSYGEGHLLAHLPNGVVSVGGITLTDIGAPRSCWDCDLTYIRYVVFSMKVV